ncbi:MAG: FHA domain-containing protein, partial [Planctomycetota bacterium]
MPPTEPNPSGEPGTAGPPPTLRLESIAGPTIEPLELVAVGIEEDPPTLVGRSSAAHVQLDDRTVSRRHVEIARRPSGWLITDLESRHGTTLNGLRLDPHQPVPLTHGDLLRIGPWTFRVLDPDNATRAFTTTNDLASVAHRVEKVPARELRSVPQHRLDLLMACAAKIQTALDPGQLSELLVDAAVEGTGFARAAFVRQVNSEGDVEVLAYRGPAGDRDLLTEGDTFSRSLLEAASSGEIVRLAGDATAGFGESVMRLGIHTAICVPVKLGDSIEGHLYLDARDSERTVHPDAAAFAQALGQLGALALSGLKRLDLERHRQQVEADLHAARRAQRLITPAAEGTIGRVRYAARTKPGRYVAGDLLDVMALPGDARQRVAITLGDVAGKGAGASIVMAAAQSFCRAAFETEADPGAVVRRLNQFLCGRTDAGTFLSLWVGVIDPANGELLYVDAGHGHWLV